MDKKSILIVEGEEAIALELRNMLLSLGYPVTAVLASGEAAIAAVAAGTPDLVLMDIQPAGEMDALSAAEILALAGVPVLFLISSSQLPLLPKAEESCYGYLVKPVSRRELAVTVEIALSRHALRRQLKEGLGERGPDELEHLVRERTAELLAVNLRLQREVEERRLAEEERTLGTAVLAAVFEGFPEPLFLLDAKQHIIMANKAAMGRFGLEPIGKSCHGPFYDGRCTPASRKLPPFSRCFAHEVSESERLEQANVVAIRRRSGEVGAYVVRFEEPAGKDPEGRLIQYERLASLGMLVAGIAHEINNLNTFVHFNIPILRTYLQFLLPFADDHFGSCPERRVFGRSYREFREDCLKLVDNVEHGSTRICQIVGNLREFARERGRLEMSRVQLRTAVEKALSLCIGRVRRTVKHFEVDFDEGLPDLLADQVAIEQVVVNLLVNAAQAADKEDSWVKLSVTAGHEPPGAVILEISDNGCGMDKETQKRIFDPFFTTKAAKEGTGLGLSISHRLVTELGGTIKVRSEVGRGCSVRVEFCRPAAECYGEGGC